MTCQSAWATITTSARFEAPSRAARQTYPKLRRQELVALVDARQAELHDAAISLGRRLYSEGPRRYVEKLEGLWRAWEDETPRQVEHAGLPVS